MSGRMFNLMAALAIANLILYAACRISITSRPGAGPEGIGTGLLGILSLIFSALLYGTGANQLIEERRRHVFSKRTLFVVLLAIAPLLHFAIFDLLLLKLRQRHTSGQSSLNQSFMSVAPTVRWAPTRRACFRNMATFSRRNRG